MKSLAILSLFIAVSVAQSSNPLIPSGISESCTAYLTSFNSDTSFSACTNPITTATAPFAPGANSSNITTSTINDALSGLCSSSAFSACPDSTVRSQLMAFYSACSAELTSNVNEDVLRTYDVLYVLTPLRQALCSKSDNGSYCAMQLPSTNGTTATGNKALVTSGKQGVLQQYLYTTPDLSGSTASRRDTTNTTTALIPNVTTYRDTDLVFLFLEPSMSTTQLCTTCTRNILTPYITFESSLPYAPGLNSSLLLGGQSALYNAILEDCPTGFMSGAVQAAGGLSSGVLSGSAPRTVSADVSLLVSAMLGAAGLVISAI